MAATTTTLINNPMNEHIRETPSDEQLAVLTRIAVALEKIATHTAAIMQDCYSTVHSLERIADEHGAVPGRRNLCLLSLKSGFCSDSINIGTLFHCLHF